MSGRVLVVDDSGIARTMIKKALADGGFEVAAEAQDGLEAVDLAGRVKPDVITMDYSMPNLDGEEALKRILAVDPAARVVMLTSLAEPMLREDLLKLGAKAVLAKPFKDEDLVKAVRAAI